MTNPKLLIVEDDEGLCRQYRWALSEYQLFISARRREALAIAMREQPPIALIDLGLPPDADGASEGLGLLQELLGIVPNIKIVIATGSDDIAHAVQAISMGAFDFFQKPVDIEVLRIILGRALSIRELEEENRRLQQRPLSSSIPGLITSDEQMLRVCRSIEKLAAIDVIVLILGESGTGKEVLAHALHELGPRTGGPFIPINCAAIPETLLESELFGHERGAFTGAVRQSIGKIESANHGTLFLDEIGDVPAPLQVKLLRFLQDQIIERVGGRQRIRVDVRIVCATNQNLETKMAQGEFREDLFYRLNEVSINVPPLRNRPGDSVLLANHFLTRFSKEYKKASQKLSSAAIAAIVAHNWPGNVRELENRIKRAVVMAEDVIIEPGDLALTPAEDQADLDIRAARTKAEREVIQSALARSKGIIATAARLLGVSRPTLYSLMDAHGIAPALDESAGDLKGSPYRSGPEVG